MPVYLEIAFDNFDFYLLLLRKNSGKKGKPELYVVHTHMPQLFC